MDEKDRGRIEQRLEQIEGSISQIKIILLVVLVILVVGVFGPAAVVQVIGGMVFVVGVGGCVLYAGLLVMDKLLKRKLGTEKEREARILKKILESTDTENKEDQR